MDPGRPVKILHLIDSLPREGAEMLLFDLIQRSDRKVLDFSVCALTRGGGVEKMLAELGVPVHLLRRRSAWDGAAFRRLCRIVRSGGVEIVHTHIFSSHLWGAAAGRRCGAKVMRTEHNMSEWKRGWRARADRVLARMTDRAIAVSEPVRTSLIEVSGFAPERVVTIANGLNLRRIEAMAGRTGIREELGLKPGSLLAGTSAALTPKKGHRYLLEAAALVREKFPDLHFLLLGDGELREEIAEGIRARNLEGNVHLLGSRPDALEIVAGLDVFVMSSVREGLSIALLEAMALGRPVVVTAVGGAVEVIEDGISGVLVPERDGRALAAGITTVLASSSRAAEMGSRARAVVEQRFDFDRMVRRYEEEYLHVGRPSGKRLPEAAGSGTMTPGNMER